MFSPELIEKLKYYVYLYVNPIDGKIFYVGKGKGNRVFNHLTDNSEHDKNKLIQEIRDQGKEPIVEILIHGLEEDMALKIESSVIDLIGIRNLSNKVLGWGSNLVGRMEVKQLCALYEEVPAVITDPIILFRINKKFRYGMSQQELYEVTRGVWRIAKRREKAQFAFSVYRGIIKEVYVINSWHPAGTLLYQTRSDYNHPGRWEFDGEIAQQSIREKYLDKSVEDYFPSFSQSPFVYVNC